MFPPNPDNRRLIALYAAVVFLYWASLYLYVPTLPTYAASKSENLALVGVVVAQYGLWQGIVRLPLGIAADRLGRCKPFIVAGIALAGLGALTMGLANGANGLIVGRAITGLAAATWVPLVAAFSGLFPPHEAVRASAILTLVGSMGRMLATALTGSLNELGGHRLAFFLATGVAAVSALAALPAPEKAQAARRLSMGNVGRLISRRDVLLPALLAAVSQYVNWASTFGFVPVLARQLGATDMTQSILATLHIGVATLGNLVAAVVARHVGPRRLVYCSLALSSGGLGLAAWAPSLPFLFVAQFCLGLSQGVGYPVLMGMSIERVAQESRAIATGLHQAVYAAGMFAGPALSGTLADTLGIRPMFGWTAGVSLIMGAGIALGMGEE